MPPARHSPTLEEVAALAGVGRGTASRVINGSPQVAEATRASVLRAVAELGYVPNRAARSLVTRRTDSVALVVSEPEERFFAEPFFAAIVRGITAAVTASSRQLLLAMAHSAQERERLESYLTSQRVDGVLLLSLHGNDPLPVRLEERGLPTVVGGRPVGWDPVSYVDVDNLAGGRLAVAHLLQRGRRVVATIAGPSDMTPGTARLSGYVGALEDAGLPYDPSLVELGDFSEGSGVRAMEALLERRPDVDAVFAASDPMAAGALRALKAAGRRVPDDVALVGFDDSPVTRLTEPPLTTVHQPVEAMGREMALLLVSRIENDGDAVPPPVILQPHLVVRAST